MSSPSTSAESQLDALLSKLPSTDKSSEEAKRQRDELFQRFDPNNNGYLSLAEIDKGCRDVLGLYDAFREARPVVMRAYQAAKGIHDGGGAEDSVGRDYVERNEFRLLLVYLRRYMEIWQIFTVVDQSSKASDDGPSDRRITLDEFTSAMPQINTFFAANGTEYRIPTEDAKNTFDEIDANRGGMILFDEFAAWVLSKIQLE